MKIITTNKKAFFDYQILEKYEAGIVLIGAEVKSIKAGRVNLKGSYVIISDGVPRLLNCHIAHYKGAGGKRDRYNPTHTRNLLLKKKEINSLIGKVNQKGLTLLPLSVYTKRGFVKIEIGLGRGKKLKDKREILKKKAVNREIQRMIRGKINV